jgi:hypothetical protein
MLRSAVAKLQEHEVDIMVYGLCYEQVSYEAVEY